MLSEGAVDKVDHLMQWFVSEISHEITGDRISGG